MKVFCTKCGSKINDNAKFCTVCGAALKPAQSQTANEKMKPTQNPAANETVNPVQNREANTNAVQNREENKGTKQAQNSAKAEKSEKKIPTGLLVGAGAAVAAAALVIGVGSAIMLGKGDKEASKPAETSISSSAAVSTSEEAETEAEETSELAVVDEKTAMLESFRTCLEEHYVYQSGAYNEDLRFAMYDMFDDGDLYLALTEGTFNGSEVEIYRYNSDTDSAKLIESIGSCGRCSYSPVTPVDGQPNFVAFSGEQWGAGAYEAQYSFYDVDSDTAKNMALLVDTFTDEQTCIINDEVCSAEEMVQALDEQQSVYRIGYLGEYEIDYKSMYIASDIYKTGERAFEAIVDTPDLYVMEGKSCVGMSGYTWSDNVALQTANAATLEYNSADYTGLASRGNTQDVPGYVAEIDQLCSGIDSNYTDGAAFGNGSIAKKSISTGNRLMDPLMSSVGYRDYQITYYYLDPAAQVSHGGMDHGPIRADVRIDGSSYTYYYANDQLIMRCGPDGSAQNIETNDFLKNFYRIGCYYQSAGAY